MKRIAGAVGVLVATVLATAGAMAGAAAEEPLPVPAPSADPSATPSPDLSALPSPSATAAPTVPAETPTATPTVPSVETPTVPPVETPTVPPLPEPTPPPGLEATVRPARTTSDTARLPVYDADGRWTRDALWHLTDAGGSCCAVYLAGTAGGRLVELGGGYPVYSDDRGATWYEVVPDLPAADAQGAVAVAPNGDVVGVAWDRAGDRLVAFKHDAAAQRWWYRDVPGHQPLFERPWVAVVPGPFTRDDGTTAPYATVLRSHVASDRQDVMYVSLDGLTYVPESDEPAQVSEPLVTGYLEVVADAAMDVLQPHPAMRVTPLPRGGFLNVAPSLADPACPSTAYGADRAWSCVAMPGHAYTPGLRVDSRGWLHEVERVSPDQLRYATSADGGRSWSYLTLPVPFGGTVDDLVLLDHKANGALGRAAVAVHAQMGDVSRDVVYRVDTTHPRPALVETMLVGGGTRRSVPGDPLAEHRFDVASVVLLPDGTVAVAFDDGGADAPRIAVEVPGGALPPATLPPLPTPTPLPTPLPSPTVPAPTPLPSLTPAPTPSASVTQPATTDTRAPAASAVLPRRVTDPVVVRFDEPVTGAGGVALRLANGTPVAASATCRDRGVAAPCAGAVTEVVLRPAAALRPGERYVVLAGGARDAAGNAAATARFGFRASTVEEQASPAARWSWRTVRHASAAGGSYAVERRAGATATYAFRGTSVTWVGAAGPGQGVVDVYVDGVRRATVDTDARAARWRVARTVRGLADGAHVLALRVRGDGPVVVDDVPGATPAGAAWATAPHPGFSGRTAAFADGGEVTFGFRGTGVTWVTAAGPEMGRAAVYVDGRLWGTFDNYAPSRRYDLRRAVTGLADGVHRVTIRALGPSIVVDRWLVR